MPGSWASFRYGQPVIFVGNHQSSFDILSYFAGLPLLFRVPLFGLAMRRSGYIAIDRSDRRKAMRSVTFAAERIRGGTSVVIFPEGTRSGNGRLQEFKKGGFLLALKAQLLIVPIAISGSWQVMHKGDLRFKPGTIRFRILPRIETAGLTSKDTGIVMERVRNSLATAIDEESTDVAINGTDGASFTVRRAG